LSHDGSTYQTAAVLRGGYLELARGKLTGDLDCNGKNLLNPAMLALPAVPKVAVASASDTLRISNDTEVQINQSTYTLAKETYLGHVRGTLRIRFDLRSTSSGPAAYGRVYINGIAVGPEHVTYSTTPTTFTDDIAGIRVHDRIQVYAYISAPQYASAAVSNFRIYFDMTGADEYGWAVV
jgi:hypothetical protein